MDEEKVYEEVEFNFGVDVSFKIDRDFLTEELMDAYEECFHEISDDSDFDNLESRRDKHMANIAWYLMRGETHFIEGYGSVSNFVKSEDVSMIEVVKDS